MQNGHRTDFIFILGGNNEKVRISIFMHHHPEILNMVCISNFILNRFNMDKPGLLVCLDRSLIPCSNP